jgi:hypothetical protein
MIFLVHARFRQGFWPSENACTYRLSMCTWACPGKDGQIACVEEYRFMLYRHWTLFDSMYHSPFIATKLGTWVNETSGKQKLDTMLVGMGIPKRESSEK